MSRFAEARERAGFHRVPENAVVWDQEHHRASRLLEIGGDLRASASRGTKRAAPVIAEPTHLPRTASPNLHVLHGLVRRVFFSPNAAPIRSVLFCTPAGEPLGDVAWTVAELLALESGQRVCSVEEGSRPAPRRLLTGGSNLVTRLGWFPPEAASGPPAGSPLDHHSEAGADPTAVQAVDALGEHVSDLYESFEYVIVNATASQCEDLVPLAREVDGVILLVAENRTRRDAADRLATVLRAAAVSLLGVVLTNRTHPIPEALYRMLSRFKGSNDSIGSTIQGFTGSELNQLNLDESGEPLNLVGTN